MRKMYFAAPLLFFLAASFAQAETLDDLLKRIHENNPEIKAAYQKWKVAEKDARAVSTWPNPTLSYVAEKDPSGQIGVEPMDRKHYSIDQEIPFPGKISNAARMKHHEALIAEATYQETVLDVERRLKLSYFQLYTVDRMMELSKKNTDLMRSTLASAQGRAASNLGSGSDVFMAKTELSQMENMLFENEQERKVVQIELNSLLNEAPDKNWPVLDADHKPILKDFPYSLKESLVLAENNNPLYRSAGHEINHSRAMLTRSRLGLAPDLGVMYEYQTAGEGGGIGEAGQAVGLSLSVPLWINRPLAEKAGAKAHVAEAEAMGESMKNMVRKMTAMTYTDVQTHLQLARSIESKILPSAEAAFTTAREQYAAGRGDFLRVLEANRAWVKAGKDFQEQVYHYAEHWAELERWIGKGFDKENSNGY